MPDITEIIKEEYERVKNLITSYEKTIKALPKGYITTKTIKGRQYHYLQWREGKTVRSEYIDYNRLDEFSERVFRRKEYENKVKELKREKKDLEKILK